MTVIGDPPTEGAPYDPSSEQLRRDIDWVPHPKPLARIVDRKVFAAFWEGAWEDKVCQVCGHRWLHASIHHIVPRGQGGDDVPANFALLCGHGTAGCHGDVEARRNGARERLRSVMTPEQLRYVLEKKGDFWLDRHYPQEGAA